jgi:hypothetical protein
MDNLFFVDCEARGVSPVNGTMTEFGVVHYKTRKTFHGRLYEGTPDPENPAIPIVGNLLVEPDELANELIEWMRGIIGNKRAVLVSDNPAYDFMWMAGFFDRAGVPNPFGHSGRRIADFYAGLTWNWHNTQGWKKYRKTVHDHNPVNDSMGNVEAFEKIMKMQKITY